MDCYQALWKPGNDHSFEEEKRGEDIEDRREAWRLKIGKERIGEERSEEARIEERRDL